MFSCNTFNVSICSQIRLLVVRINADGIMIQGMVHLFVAYAHLYIVILCGSPTQIKRRMSTWNNYCNRCRFAMKQ